MTTDEIVKLTSDIPGPTVALFAGTHGNERAGIYALEKLLPILTPTKGTIYIAFTNPPAIVANERMITKNMNRCFMANNQGDSYEDKRARELMNVLDDCDALLDLHMFYDKGKPFAICEENALQVAKLFDVAIISTNWNQIEPGAADGYMFEQGKIGVCVECGPIPEADNYVDFATKTIYQFLQYFDMSPKKVEYSVLPKRYIVAKKAVYKTRDNFTLEPGFETFQKLNNGQLIAADAQKQFHAHKDECIIFPHYRARVGEEVYIIGTEK
jgi:succinylglutamate desuccinylase